MSAKNLTPHDHYFRSIMSNPNTALEFLGKHLPDNINAMIDYAELHMEQSAFIDDKLKEKISDILYSTKFNGKPGYIYILIEHQNKPEKLMPFRMLQYMTAIMEQHLQDTNNKELPVIYPMIFYAGRKKYNYSTDLFALFGEHRELALNIFCQPYRLINLQNISDAEFNDLLFYGTMAKVMKNVHFYKNDILPLIKMLRKNLNDLENIGNLAYICRTLKYFYLVGNVKNRQKLRDFITTSFSKKIGDNIMSYADQLRSEGKAEGRAEGISLGISQGISQGASMAMQTIVQRLLQQNADIQQIMKITDLTKEQIEAIKKQC